MHDVVGDCAERARRREKKQERKKSLWQRAVDLALTDVRVLGTGMDEESLDQLEERLGERLHTIEVALAYREVQRGGQDALVSTELHGAVVVGQGGVR